MVRNVLIVVSVTLCIVSSANLLHENDKFLENLIKDVQRNLAQKITLQPGTTRNTISITHKKVFEKQLMQNVTDEFILPFEAFNRTFLLVGPKIFEVEADDTYNIQFIRNVPFRDTPQQILFAKAVEWRAILLLLVAFRHGYCSVYTAASAQLNFVLRQSIHNFGQSQDADFFKRKNDVYLALVMQNCDQHSLVLSYIYRWTGTHLDATEKFPTIGATAVRTFQSDDDVIIVVAQNLPDNPGIGSQVLRMYDDKLERLHLMATQGPISLHPFTVKGEQFMLVINEKESSHLFWWSGQELYPWETLPEIKGKFQVAVTKFQGFLFLLQEQSIRIYHPDDEMNFRAIQILRVRQEEVQIQNIFSFGSSQNIVMYISRHGTKLYAHMFLITYVKESGKVFQRKTVDPIVQCFELLNQLLDNRQEKIQQIQNLSDNLLLVNEAANYTGNLSVTGIVHVNNLSAASVLIDGERLETTSSKIVAVLDELNTRIHSLNDTIHSVISNSKSGVIYSNIVVNGDLEIGYATAENFTANVINGKLFEPQHWLTYDGNETITSARYIYNIIAHNLNAEYLSQIKLSDVLVTNTDQVITGKFTVSELLADTVNVNLGEGLHYHPSSRAYSELVEIQTKMRRIKTTNLTVDIVNGLNVSSRNALESNFEERNSMMLVSHVSTSNLFVHNVNEMPWNSFINKFFLKQLNQSVEGDLTFTHPTVHVNNLILPMVNGIFCEHLMTKSTDQNVVSTLLVNYLKASDVEAETINKLHISTHVARNNTDNFMSGPVAFDNLIGNLTGNVPASVVFSTDNNKTRIFTGKVQVSGTLHTLHLAAMVHDIKFGDSHLHMNDHDFQLSDLYDRYWTTNTEQTIVVDVEFMQPLYVEGLLYANYLNGYSKERYIHMGTTYLHGNLEFESVHAKSNVTGDSNVTISGVDLALLDQEAVKKTAGEYIVYGTKKFRGGLTIEKLNCRCLNGVDVVKDIPKINSNFIFADATKYFENLIIENDVMVQGPINSKYINNIHLTEKLKSIIFVNDSVYLQKVEFENLKARNIVMANIIDNVPPELMPNRTEWHQLEIHGSADFMKGVKAKRVNEIDIGTYLPKVLSKTIGGFVNGNVRIHGRANVEYLNGTKINGIDLKRMNEKALSKTKDQNLTEFVTITNAFTVNLEANLISGINMSDLIYTNDVTQEMINADIKFINVEFHNLVIDNFGGCDVNKVLQLIHHIEGSNKTFDCISIYGPLHWLHSAPQENSLVHIFNSSVKLRENQNITGKVTFNNTVLARFVETKQVINDVDLNFIMRDALMKHTEHIQEINGIKYFENELKLRRGHVVGNAQINIVNNVDILALNASLIRGYEDGRIIRGHKHFVNGFNADQLHCNAINNINPKDIATYDTPILPHASFESLEIVDYVNVKTINSINIQKKLKERVTLKEHQIIEGNWTFKGSLKLHGNTKIGQINDVLVSDMVYIRDNASVIGRKTFLNHIIVHGALDTDLIDGIDVTNLYKQALMADEDAVIEGNVVFVDNVTLQANLDVEYLINGINMEDLPRRLHQEAIDNKDHIDSYRRHIQILLEKNFLKLSDMAREFMYFEEQHELQLQLQRVHSARVAVQTDKSHGTLLSAFAWEDATKCGLPQGCLCPSQVFAFIRSNGSVDIHKVPSSEREFYHMSPRKPDFIFRVSTNSVSVSRKCRVPLGDEGEQKEITSLSKSIANFNSNPIFKNVGSSRLSISGFLADMKGFTIGSVTYVILAVYYNASLDTHNLESSVYKMDNGDSQPVLIQKLATYGVRAIDILQPRHLTASHSIHLVVGNTYDSKRNTSNVNIDIYRFDAKLGTFKIFRKYPTHGVITVRGMVLDDGERFVLVVQRYKAPLLILRYDSSKRNYHFFQEISFVFPVLDLGVFNVGGDVFFGAVTANGNINLYKYAYVEGFKLISSYVHKGVLGFTPFSVSNKQYVFLPTTEFSSVLEIMTQGP